MRTFASAKQKRAIMKTKVNELRKKFEELARQRVELEEMMRDAVRECISESVRENPNPIKKTRNNCFTISLNAITGNPFNPSFYDWELSVSYIIKFLESKPVENWKSELEKKLDSSKGSSVNLIFTTRCGYDSATNTYPIDRRFIEAILRKL